MPSAAGHKLELRRRRHARVRKRITGTSERPRLSVFRSARHIRAQVVDDTTGRTLAAASTEETLASTEETNASTEETIVSTDEAVASADEAVPSTQETVPSTWEAGSSTWRGLSATSTPGASRHGCSVRLRESTPRLEGKYPLARPT